jgi:hypothetical protein
VIGWVLASACLGAACSPSHPVTTGAQTAPPASVAGTAPTAPTATSVTSPRFLASSRPRAQVVARLPGSVQALASGSGVVYVDWVVPVKQGTPRFFRVSRFDVRLGRVTATSLPIHDLAGMAVSDGSLWVSAETGSLPGRHQGGTLLRLDGSSLRVLHRTRLATPTGALATAPAGLWVSNTHRLLLVDPASGDVIRRVIVIGSVSQVVVDASTNTLYDATHRPDFASTIAIEQRNATTGALRDRTTALRGMPSVNTLAASPRGVWLAYATGNLGLAERLPRGHLQRPSNTRPRADAGTNGIGVYQTADILWIDEGVKKLWCADPTTGRARDYLPERGWQGYAGVTRSAANVFAGTGQKFERITPGTACAS